MAEKGKEKVAIYIRTSSESQDASHQEQLEFIQDYCERKGFEIAWQRNDEMSGYEDETRRPGFKRLISDQEKYGFTKIVCWKSERAFRQTEVMLRVRRVLKARGCYIIGAHDIMEDDDSAEAGFVLGLTSVGDEYFRNKVRDRVKASHKYKVGKGLHQGGIAPFGYVSSGEHVIGNVKYAMWQPDQEVFGGRTVAQWVEFIFQEFIRCRNATTIALALNSAGVPTPGYLGRWHRLDELERARRLDKATTRLVRSEGELRVKEYPPSNIWDPSTISSVILRSRAYLGEISYTEGQGKNNSHSKPKQKTWRQGLHEPIITPQLYNQVQALLDARASKHRKPADRVVDVLLGGVIVCGECGKAVSRVAKNAKQRRYYCNRARTTRGTGCNEPRYNTNTVDEAASRLLLRGIKLRRKQILEGVKLQPKKGLENLVAEIDKLEAEKERIKKLFAKGYIDELELDSEMAPVISRIEDLRSKIDDDMQPSSIYELDIIIANIQAYWSRFSIEKRRIILLTYAPKGFTLANGLLRGVVCGIPLETDVNPLPPPTKGVRYGGRKKKAENTGVTNVSTGSEAPTLCGGVTSGMNPAAPIEGPRRLRFTSLRGLFFACGAVQMALEQRILEQLRRLSPSRQREVLDFAEFLANRSPEPSEVNSKGWPARFATEVLGGWQGEPLERSDQGQYEQRTDFV